MHYKQYCQAHPMFPLSPLAAGDFYQGLQQIATSRAAVLAEVERMPATPLSEGYAVVQRCIDVLLAGLGILIGAVPALAIAIAVKIDSTGPVFYRQKRVGKGGRVFVMIKFRTMCHYAERITGPVWAAKGDARLTRVGAFLRKVRLDELPQLLNILKGEMTFVGPRPERPEFVYQFIQYLPAFDRRHAVKPGLTGLAQLMNGYDSSAKSVYRKLRWDARYLRQKCLLTDFCILYRTVIAVLSGRV